MTRIEFTTNLGRAFVQVPADQVQAQRDALESLPGVVDVKVVK
jgi:hypothetical protein